MNKIMKYIKKPRLILQKILTFKIFLILSDKQYLKLKYFITFKKKLDLENPKTFNEKLQWLKLYDRNPLYTKLVDKYEVKKYISEKIGEEYIIPTLGVWEKFSDIDFDKLPNQFVLKCTHDSGGLIICKDKSNLDYELAEKKINKSLKRNYYYSGREWPYKNVKPRIIAEKYMVDESGTELKDYKLFCFGGEVKSIYVVSGRGTDDITATFYDPDFNLMPMRQYYHAKEEPMKKPAGLEKMKELASILSKDIPHVRVDFYDINGKIYFGEMTFYHFSGTKQFHPDEWDKKFGDWIDLSKAYCYKQKEKK